jgi:hypothetical protein
MWKVVQVDNYDRDHIDDILVMEELDTEKDAKKVAEFLEKIDEEEGCTDWVYRVYPQEQKLKKFEP